MAQHAMTHLAAALLALAAASCAETDIADPSVVAAKAGDCNPYAPPVRLWNGVAYAAPSGKAVLVLDSDPDAPNIVHAYFIDRVGDYAYDHVKVARADVGKVLGAAAALPMELATAGSSVGVVPTGPRPRPGTELIFALALARAQGPLQTDAVAEAAVCAP